MHHLQVGNKINLPTLIFQNMIKIVKGNIKTIPYGMHLSYLIRRKRCNIDVDPLLQQSKYTSFDKNTFGRMQYIMDAQGNYVKKLDNELELPEKQPELEK